MPDSLCKSCAHEQVCKYSDKMKEAEKFMEGACEQLKAKMGVDHLAEEIIRANPHPSCSMYMIFPLKDK